MFQVHRTLNKVGLCAQILRVFLSYPFFPASGHFIPGCFWRESDPDRGLSREPPRRKMKPSVEQEARLTPCCGCSMLPSHLSADTNRCWDCFFFFLLCFVVVYFAFHNSNSFLRQRKKRKALGRTQVFISAEGISIAFVKLSWSVKAPCLWLTVAESESIN